jgi:hypothetical protein
MKFTAGVITIDTLPLMLIDALTIGTWPLLSYTNLPIASAEEQEVKWCIHYGSSLYFLNIF